MEQALGGTLEALFEDRADLIVGAIENVPDQYTRSRQGIRTHPWLPVEMVFVASPQHPICDEPQPLNTETIQQYRGVVVADTASRLGSLTRGTFRQSNLLYVSNMQEKLEAHIASLGIGRVPLFLAQPHIETGRLVALPTTIGRMSEPTTLAYRATHRGRALSYLVEALLKAQLF
jgi:DNA-binding transcriptional LysR family regulator